MTTHSRSRALIPEHFRTEYRLNPLGMDEPSPRFSYRLRGDALQTARQIRVVREGGGLAWDSGWVPSGESVQIEYAGEPLAPFTRYDWRVRIRDEAGNESPWSGEETFFETGFLGAPWTAKWISGNAGMGSHRPAPRLFKTFTRSDASPRKARLYITALGLYEAYLNGRPVTEDCLAPGWTQYDVRVPYRAYDVTPLLKPGENTLAVLLGRGWWCGLIATVGVEDPRVLARHPLLKAELAVTSADGTTERIVTDRSWSSVTMDQALVRDDIYLGESYDATFDDQAWKQPGYVSASTPLGSAREETHPAEIVWSRGAPVRRIAELRPVAVHRHPSGTFIMDFGRNIAGRERIRVRTPRAGATIVIKHGEMLNPDGSLHRKNLAYALATTEYTCGRNDGTEVYEPRFTYYGFRYLEVSGWPGEVGDDDITVQVLASEMEPTGAFHCDHELLNRLYANVVTSQQANFVDVPTDCPQRCERFGWTGDAQVFADTAMWNADAAAFFTKWIQDLNDACDPETGAYPPIAPDPCRGQGRRTGSAGWSDAGVVCPWELWRKYGDRRVCERTFDSIVRYLDHVIASTDGTWIAKSTIGDHLNVDTPTSRALIATAYLAGMARLAARMARLVGRDAEAARLENTVAQTRSAFQAQFFNGAGELTERTQTAACLAVHFDLCPESSHPWVAAFLEDDIRRKHNLHLTTGFLGTPILLSSLTKLGLIDLAYDLLLQTSFPGWLYPVTQGATSIWERWNGWTDTAGFHPSWMNSFNHYAFGSVAAWFFETICGIRPDDASDVSGQRAFRHFILAPQFGRRLNRAEAAFTSPYGVIRSAWQRDGGRIVWRVGVPCNTTATIHPPLPVVSAEGANLSENADGTFSARPGEAMLVLRPESAG